MNRKWAVLAALLLSLPTSPPSHAAECYTSSIVNPQPFMGNSGELFKLSDGSVWEVGASYAYLYAYYPSVIICPQAGYLVVNDKKIMVSQVAAAKSKP